MTDGSHKPRRAAVLSVGNEVVQGFLLNTNSQWLAVELGELGFDVQYHLALLDREDDLTARLKAALAENLFLVVTGGIGPTEDDRTRQAVAQALGVELVMDHEALHALQERYSQLGRPFPRGSEIQCMAPKGAVTIKNAFGTASCFYWRNGPLGICCMPGVPREMKGVWREEMQPLITNDFGLGERFYSREIKCFGLPESEIDIRVKHLLPDGGKSAIEGAILVDDGVIRLRWRMRARREIEAIAALQPFIDQARGILGEIVFAEGDVSLEAATVNLLREKKLNVALAESCTGGMIAHLLTQVPGSSEVLLESAVVYSNESKQRRLGVKAETLAAHGAVSEASVREMARAMAMQSKADICLSVSGIAGPGGGTQEKPVGTIWMALAIGEQVAAWRMTVPGERELVKLRTARAAINAIRLAALHGKPPARPTHFSVLADGT